MQLPSDLQDLSHEAALNLIATLKHQLNESEHKLQQSERKLQRSELKLQNTEFKLTDAKLKCEEAEHKLADIELKCEDVEHKLSDTEHKLQDAEHKLEVLIQLTADKLKILEELTLRAQHRIIVPDKVLSLSLEEQLEILFDELTEWINDAIAWRATAFGKGPDVKPKAVKDHTLKSEEDVLKEQKSQLAKAHECGAKALRMMTQINNTVTSVVTSMTEEERQVCGEVIDKIMSTKTPEPEHNPEKSRNPGRQSKNRSPDRNTHHHAPPGGSDCKKCGTKNQVIDEQFKSKFIRTLSGFNKSCEVLAAISDIEVCPKCGQVHVPIGDEDVPVTPNRELSLDMMLDCAECVYMGIPLNRLAATVKAEVELGHNTIERNLHDFVRIYLKPIYEHILKKAKSAKALLADGTPFDCLENQGKGACVNKRQDHKSAELTEGKSNYILSFCSVPLADEIFSCYGFLPTRSYESIKKILTDEFKFETLITDAFSGYEKLAIEHQASLQHCLIHFRRYVIKALDPMAYIEQMLKLPEKELHAFIKDEFSQGSDHALLFSVFTAIGKIYAFEASVDLNFSKAKEELMAVRTYEKSLLDGIDKIMSVMLERHMQQDHKNPGHYKPKRGDPYSKLCSYWYNNHEHFRVYLKDPMIPPDSNLVEQSIRPLTVLRKNCYFKSSNEYMEDLCIIYTVFRTMARRKVENSKSVLRQYCRALYSHCLDEGYTKAYRDGMELNKKILSWDMLQLSTDFDFESYFKVLMKPAG